ncbi:MAG: MauE/DoxX family redox-associated membrane protein, partial [Solirubrobacteraceae bacterium]
MLAAVFTLAAVGKLRDLPGSRRAMRDFGVPARAARVAGLLLPLVELGTAAALVLTPTARWGAIAALLLLLAF